MQMNCNAARQLPEIRNSTTYLLIKTMFASVRAKSSIAFRFDANALLSLYPTHAAPNIFVFAAFGIEALTSFVGIREIFSRRAAKLIMPHRTSDASGTAGHRNDSSSRHLPAARCNF